LDIVGVDFDRRVRWHKLPVVSHGQFACCPRTIHHHRSQNPETNMVTILIIILILMLIGAFPAWPHATSWGYGPFGGIGVILVIVIIVLLLRGGL
jgi:uncharacterized protein DUF3309